jgi:hypothetical protein
LGSSASGTSSPTSTEPASASFTDLFQNDESVTVTQLRADGGINAAKIIVFGQTGSSSDVSASLWAREPVEVEGGDED